MGYYAYTKYKGENLIKKYSKKFDYKYAILRYFNVAGASSSNKIGQIERSHGQLFKNISIQALKKKPVVSIYGNNYKTKDGTCIRDYIHVSDLAEIHIKCVNYLFKKKKSIILNCGYGKGYSVKDIINIFKNIRKDIRIIYEKRRSGDIAQVYANIRKFKKTLKWKPRYNNIKKILLSSIQWEKKLQSSSNVKKK
jgi:UDP-glucose 4-epimerase